MELVFITGMSGAGRSQAMKAMEDIGYFCIDNLPPVLIPKFVELTSKNKDELTKVALVIDIRGGRFFDEFEASLEQLDRQGQRYNLVFLESNEKVLIKRFKEARRTHPLKPYGSIEEGIKIEIARLADIRDRSSVIIDTSSMNIAALRSELYKIFLEGKESENMTITVISFGYKKGIPLDADLVFDVRMLPNPYYVEELKPLTGNDKSVQDYVMKFHESQVYLTRIKQMVDFLIPQCIKEGRGQFVVAIGCTGGQHRSVTFANMMTEYLGINGHRVTVNHREVKQ